MKKQYQQRYGKRRKKREKVIISVGVLVIIFCGFWKIAGGFDVEERASGWFEGIGTDEGGRMSCKLTKEELSQDIPLLLQTDGRWGEGAYGNSNIEVSGCAPTCMSMVVVGLTHNEKATPKMLAEYAQNEGYYVEGVGTVWDFFAKGGQKFGVDGKEISLDKTVVMRQLTAGNPIVCSMRPGDFTTEGHFIVLTGVSGGMIEIHDPASSERSDRLWDYDVLEPQIKNLWAFSLL